MKEISFVGDTLNTRTLLVVLECLKDRAFHMETAYVNSLNPMQSGLHTLSRADRYHFKRKRQLCNGRVWWLGNPQFHNSSLVASCAMFTKVCAARINYLEIS